jgi:hypothetical protein
MEETNTGAMELIILTRFCHAESLFGRLPRRNGRYLIKLLFMVKDLSGLAAVRDDIFGCRPFEMTDLGCRRVEMTDLA